MNIGKENEYVEFKRSSSELKEGIQSICAILNKHKKGTLFFGVKNNGDVVGQQIGDETLNQISRDITVNIKPSFVYSIELKQTPEGKNFIEITFHGEKTPYSAFNRYYLRFHDEDRIMDNDLLREYYRQNTNDYSYWEKRNSSKTIDDIDEQLVKDYYDEGVQKGRINYSYENTIKFLSKLGVMFDNEHLNNAGFVLFSKDEPVRLKLVTFATESRLTILDMDVFEGNVFECIKKSMDYISKAMMWRAEFDGSIRRKEVPEIPIEAIREIVVNAFSHGEYDSITDFEIAIFKNRISIYSPGHFPKPYTPEDFALGYLEPIPMNNTITQVLYKNGTIEQMSTGFERVFELCEINDIKYGYQETAYGFRFEFYRPSNTPNVTDKENIVMKVLREDNSYTINQVATISGFSPRTVARIISSLKAKGLIVRIGNDKHGYWEIV